MEVSHEFLFLEYFDFWVCKNWSKQQILSFYIFILNCMCNHNIWTILISTYK